MPYTSHSIEAEDLVIKRLFDAVVFKDTQRAGFFVDIGAYHPVLHSNTFLLYTLGWRGVNIEPNPRHLGAFEELRPGDVTLNAGVADSRRTATYHQFQNDLLNGFLPPALVQWHREHGEAYLGSIEIECLTPTDLFNNHLKQPIDLLNIDVETLEPEILAAWDWVRWRPKVIASEIHAMTMHDVENSPAAMILADQRYALMSRVFQTAMFIDRDVLGA